jgi:ACR3 family arsenite transporter
LFLSLALYVIIPVVLAQGARHVLAADRFARVLKQLQPASTVALLSVVVLLFAFQGPQILAQPLVIAILAVPILIQTVLVFGLAYLGNRAWGEAHEIAGPSALIGASNFFELAVATAISLFGLQSGAALATVVGVLIEVPLMLALVAVVNRTKGWYERRIPIR